MNTAITLPIGVEAYGAYALRAWLAADPRTSERTRRFAKWSAIGSLLLGMSGQVAYHLLSEASVVRAPWEITMAVACLPVLVLGMGAALSHLIHADAASNGADEGVLSGTVDVRQVLMDQKGDQDRIVAVMEPRTGRAMLAETPGGDDSDDGSQLTERLEIARLTALQLTSTGLRVSRRTLRDAGLRGSNAELSALVKTITAELASRDSGELSSRS